MTADARAKPRVGAPRRAAHGAGPGPGEARHKTKAKAPGPALRGARQICACVLGSWGGQLGSTCYPGCAAFALGEAVTCLTGKKRCHSCSRESETASRAQRVEWSDSRQDQSDLDLGLEDGIVLSTQS